MPDQPPPQSPRPGPPPAVPAMPPMPPVAQMPPAPLGYQTPGGPRPGAGPLDSAQRVFDTVTGPNLRLRDNLIQLACVAGGAVLGAGVGWLLGPNPNDQILYALGGALGGLVLALVVSGVVIGIVRGKRAIK